MKALQNRLARLEQRMGPAFRPVLVCGAEAEVPGELPPDCLVILTGISRNPDELEPMPPALQWWPRPTMRPSA